MSASAPFSFMESQTRHPCGLLGGTTGYKEQESSGENFLALVSPKKPDVEYFGRSARISGNLALGEVSHWFLFEKQGINNILACPSPRVGTAPGQGLSLCWNPGGSSGLN